MDVWDSSSVLPCLPVSIRGGSCGSVERNLIKDKVDYWAGLKFLLLLMWQIRVTNCPTNTSVWDLEEIQEKQENACSVSSTALEHTVGTILVHQLQK